MTTNQDFDRRLSSWLEGDAVQRVPDHLDTVLLRTAATRQQPWWSSLERWLPMDLTARANALTPRRIGTPLVIALLLLALIATAVLVVGSRRQVPPPFGPTRNGAVLTWKDGDIFIADSDVAAARPIITGPTVDVAALSSRDGTRFAFLRQLSYRAAELWIANIDGTDSHRVLADQLGDADLFDWSAHDKSLAVVSSIDGKRTLSLIDVASGTSSIAPVGGLEVDNNVAWVPPDGHSLVFTARPVAGEDGPVAIYGFAPGDTAATRISPIRSEPGSYNDMTVSSDGRTLSYSNYEADDGSPTGMRSRIHLFDPITGQDRAIEFDSTALGETGVQFSPDGRHIVLHRESVDGVQMLLATLDGSEPPRLVGPTFSFDAAPAYGFSPDGTRIYIAFENEKPTYIDVATGTATTGPDAISGFGGYQRLAR